MEFRTRQGNRGKVPKEDKILSVRSQGPEGWEDITYRDLFNIIYILARNEERTYPVPQWLGSQMLRHAITRVFDGDLPSQVAEEYVKGVSRQSAEVNESGWTIRVCCQRCSKAVECIYCKQIVWRKPD